MKIQTRFFSTRDEAEQAYEEMKVELARILHLIPDTNVPELESKTRSLVSEIKDFVKRYP